MKRNVEEMIKAYWNKEPGVEDDLYKHFTPKVKGIAYYLFNRKRDFSFDIDDYVQAGFLAIFEACNSYKEKGLPENIEASMSIFIKYRILHWRSKIKNKKGAIIESFDKTNENNHDLADLIADEHSKDPFDLVEKCIDDNTLRHELNKILKTKFDDITREVIYKLYGFHEPVRSNDYIGEELNIDSGEVASIHAKALSRFRNLDWTKKIGVLYFYGYKIKITKGQIQKNIRKKDDESNIRLYSSLLSSQVDNLKNKNIKKIWGL